jgi:glycosyltransferase involved in cell wall biosynthesis
VETTLLDRWPSHLPILRAWWSSGRPGTVHLHAVQALLGAGRARPSRRALRWLDWQLRILRRLGVRLVWTAHDHPAHSRSEDEAAFDPLEREVHGRLLARSHAVIVHCGAARRAIIAAYRVSPRAAERIHVVARGAYTDHDGVDVDPATARSALGLPAGARVFTLVGSIRDAAGAVELVDAFSGMHETSPSDRLLICGRPTARRVGRAIERRAAGDPRIILRFDRPSDAELSRTLRAADAVVLPFRETRSSGAAILAMSHGRPVIAPRGGCLPETVPADAGILYDPDQPAALAGALREALRSDLAAMGVRAREAADRMRWGPIATRTAELYGA